MKNTEFALVTPEMAGNWLKNHNSSNRPLNEERAKNFAKIIQQGKWATTHQGIAFFENGELADGQHRLRGIQIAGKAVSALVTRGLTKTDMLAIDNGKVRSTHDQLRIAGVTRLTNSGVSILRCLAMKFSTRVPTIYELENYYELHSTLIEFSQYLANYGGNVGRAAPLVAAAAVIAEYEGEDEVLRFMEILKTGILPEERRKGDLTVIRFREQLINKKWKPHGTQARKELAMVTMRVFKAYIDGQDLLKIVAPADFIYPIPDKRQQAV